DRADAGTEPEPPPGGWLVVPELPEGVDPDALVEPAVLGRLRAELADVPPLDELTRRRLVARALDAAAPDGAVPARDRAERPAAVRRGPWWQRPGLLAGAAALVVVVAIGGMLAGGGDDDGDGDIAAAGAGAD